MTTNRFGLFCLASLLGTTLTSGLAFCQAAPPPQGYPDPNAQPQYPPQQQQYQQPQQPGYPPPQQGYAPQDYQQQQPGYPQQQPGYPPQQQPGYPQQQPGYPPPQQGYPPPGYGPPPGYAPAPPPAYAPPPGHHGLLAMAYIGINGFAGETGQGIDPGLRLGGLLGFYASPMFSLNGELSIDFMNLDSNLFPNTTGVRASLSIAPLFHFPAGTGNIELVVGPKLGVWDEELSDTNSSATQSFSGYLLGLNAGAFTHVGRSSLGGLFSFESATPNKACQNDGFNGDICSSIPGSPTSEKVLAFTLAALF
jgi:hypothetical protein